MAGESFFSFVPFNLSADLRSSSLLPWIRIRERDIPVELVI
jgi:hypothetical protein